MNLDNDSSQKGKTLPITTIRHNDKYRATWRVVGWLIGASFRTLAEVEGVSQSAIGKTVKKQIGPATDNTRYRPRIGVDVARRAFLLFYTRADRWINEEYLGHYSMADKLHAMLKQEGLIT